MSWVYSLLVAGCTRLGDRLLELLRLDTPLLYYFLAASGEHRCHLALQRSRRLVTCVGELWAAAASAAWMKGFDAYLQQCRKHKHR